MAMRVKTKAENTINQTYELSAVHVRLQKRVVGLRLVEEAAYVPRHLPIQSIF